MIIYQHTQSGFRITIEHLEKTAPNNSYKFEENPLRRSKETILAMVAENEGLKSSSLLAKRRSKYLSMLRYKAMYIMWGEGYTVPEIARFFGKDRGTIKHGIEKIQLENKIKELGEKI